MGVARSLRGKVKVVETQCKFCNGLGWVSITENSIIPGADYLGAISGEDQCPFCGLDAPEPSEDTWDQIPNWVSTAIGGVDGKYAWLQQYVRGQVVRTMVVERSVFNLYEHDMPKPVQDCPVCHGCGLWNNWGKIETCLACGGLPIESRACYQPIVPWYLHGRITEDSSATNWLYFPIGTIRNARGGTSWTYRG